jgi:hypothetical protein
LHYNVPPQAGDQSAGGNHTVVAAPLVSGRRNADEPSVLRAHGATARRLV